MYDGLPPAPAAPSTIPSASEISTSCTRKNPATPITSTTIPMIMNITVQLAGTSRSNPMNPPNTTSMATSGIMALIPSILPLLVSFPESVSHALYAASLAVEPKNVITQSRMITILTPAAAASATPPNIGVSTSILTRPNAIMVTPQTR